MRFQSIRLWSTVLLCLTFAASLASSAEVRTWTSASDSSQTFEGILLDYNAYTGMVTVDRGDRQLTFKQEVLSAQDINYLKTEGVKIAEAAKSSTRSGGSGSLGISGSIPDKLPDPDGKEANMRKPVQVFILMGQSNMLGFGEVSQLKGVAADKYPYLVDDAGNWNVRKDVRNVFFNNGGLSTNDWMAVSNRNKFGPEIGIGNFLGHMIDAPVLILKSCVGNRALGWDLLPPSADGTGAKGQSYQGDSESSNRKVSEAAKAANNGWYAGLQYDKDVGAAQDALEELSTYYPDATEYEVAGFFWWQGCSEGKGSIENYDKNLAYLFKDLKKDFNAPNAKFVCATLGEHDKSATLSQKMFTFAEGDKDADVFYSKPVSTGGSCSHYGGDAETYMNVGEGMGKKMLELLGGR